MNQERIKHILVVDDESSIRDMVCTILRTRDLKLQRPSTAMTGSRHLSPPILISSSQISLCPIWKALSSYAAS